MSIKVHPGIGVARVGNSPRVLVGPEVPGSVVAPPCVIRDAECRIKRQAAIFRLFEPNADGTFSEIIADATPSITWSVRLRTDMTFVDAEVSLSVPDSVAS